MNRNMKLIFLAAVFSLLMAAPLSGQERKDELEALRQEIQILREDMQKQRRVYEAQIENMRKRLDALTSETAEEDLAAEIDKAKATAAPSETGGGFISSLGRGVQSLNPDISVIIDTNYYNSHPEGGSGIEISELSENMTGFGHSHGGEEEHEHEHGFNDGFNLRHLELFFSGEVDPYFKAYAIAAISEESAEMEEAVIQTTCLPYGLQLQAGKFFSHFGRINQQHSHQWDFVDQPLIYNLTLGEHGLNEKGAQLSWLPPVGFHLLAGIEAFQGENELLFTHLGGDELPDKEGPRLWVGWLKASPNLPSKHGLQLGIFGGRGVHQEAHDGDEDGTSDHWLDGYGKFFGGDFVYKYDSTFAYGLADFTLQGEYFWREKDLYVCRHDLNPLVVGRDRIDKQDGYYLQALYGFMPRWRAGLRWEQVGLTNKSIFPDGTSADYDDSYRLAGMMDFTPTEFSRVRFQINQGEYLINNAYQDIWEVYLQLLISIGTHGAHKF